MERVAADIYPFAELRKEGFARVDKTEELYAVASGESGRQFFMARPRRFGRSLAVSTNPLKRFMVLFLPLVAAGVAWSQQLRFSVSADRSDCMYECGDKAVYTVAVTDDGGAPAKSGIVEAILDNFGDRRISAAKFDLGVTNVFSVSGTLHEPGFLRLVLKSPGRKSVVWSVGFEPRKIRKGSPKPADFDEFWENARAKLAREVPPDVKLTRVPERSTAEYDFHRISLATFGRRVYGYISVPTDKSRAPYPVHFEVNAAGFGSWTNDMEGRGDMICVRFGVYPFDMDWRWEKLGLKEKYDAMNAGMKRRYEVPAYSQAGIAEGRERYFFYPVLLGIDRAVDWVAARADVDRKRFFYRGTSQGGGFGIYLCGLNKAFTRALFVVPALTDTMGYLAGRCSGWPKIVENNSSTPERRAAAEKWAPYFDGANFASRIDCPLRVLVGFADVTCPPCAVYAAFNEMPSRDKDAIHGIGMGHSVRRELYARCNEWLFATQTTSATRSRFQASFRCGRMEESKSTARRPAGFSE